MTTVTWELPAVISTTYGPGAFPRVIFVSLAPVASVVAVGGLAIPPPVTINETAADGTGFPCVSVTFTTSGSFKGNPVRPVLSKDTTVTLSC